MRTLVNVLAALWLAATAMPGSLSAPAPQTVGVDTLLKQESDLSTLPRLRDWTTHLQSSYERNGGNGDAQHFPAFDGKTATLADMDGPGAVVRLWSANPKGRIKIYIDDNPTPVVDAPFAKLFDGSTPPFAAPLAQPSSGGFYSYLPIPYAKHCKITVDGPQGLYYQVNSVTYPPGTSVRPFALPLAEADQAALQAAQAFWRSPDRDLFLPRAATNRLDVALPPGKVTPVALYPGPGCLRQVEIEVPDIDAASLRRLILRAYFDGHKTPDIEAPVADFFGDAYGLKPFQSLLVSQQADGTLTARFPMPFGRSARFTLENGAKKPLTAGWQVILQRQPFDPAADGYFHAQWWQETTRRGVPHVWAKVRGQRGHLVGIVQTMAGPHGLGFLEGDDQVRVDDETWGPSQVKGTVIGPWNGTGTEDCFNSGWYFSGGPNALPVNGALVREDAGRIDVYRWFLNDAPAFQRSLDAQIEHGGVNDTHDVYYSSVAYWYASGEAQPWAKLPPAAQLDLPRAPATAPRLALKGAVEGESLAPSATATGGQVQTQDMYPFAGSWSGDAQLWWTDAKPGAALTLTLTPPAAGTYDLVGYFTKAADYGQFTFQVNGQAVGAAYDAYHDGVIASGPVDLGRVTLPAGSSQFRVTVGGKNPASSGYLFGLDALMLKPAN